MEISMSRIDYLGYYESTNNREKLEEIRDLYKIEIDPIEKTTNDIIKEELEKTKEEEIKNEQIQEHFTPKTNEKYTDIISSFQVVPSSIGTNNVLDIINKLK